MDFPDILLLNSNQLLSSILEVVFMVKLGEKALC